MKEKKDKENNEAPFQEAIRRYLEDRAAKDPAFAEAYANPRKSLAQCCDYICTEVKRTGRVAMTDEEVYGLAVHYYDEENPGKIEAGLAKNARIVMPELGEDQKKRLEKEAAEDYKRNVIKALGERQRKVREIAANKRKEEMMEQPALF